MENKKNISNQSTNGSELKFESLLKALDSLFPEHNYYAENSPHRKKAKAVFGIIQSQKWTPEEYKGTLLEFVQTHNKHFWMPSDLIEIKNILYGESGDFA